MFTRVLVLLYFAFSASFVDSTTYTCASKVCFSPSNISIGQRIGDASGDTVQFLPGEYSSSDQSESPQTFLTSPFTMLSSPGFTMSSTVLPFAVTLQPGFVLYSDQFYNGQANYKSLRNSFSNKTISLLLAPGSGSIAISKDVWLAVATGSTNPTIFYDTAPLIWPSTNQSVITVIDYQSSTCQPQCSGNGVCTASATCTCAKGFTGPSCESCASGFFGPACKPCPSSCDSCDQTSGLCLTPKAAFKVDKAQKTCNCQNGQCSSDGNCSCLPGWTNATELNGVTCTQCAPGFFMTSGNCRICQLGCSKCADDTGDCISCQKGFTQDQTDKTMCDPLPTVTQNSTCPSQAFSNGQQCSGCTPPCQTCNGPSTSNCTSCIPGTSMFNGKCVTVNSDGVCEGTNGMIANNDKQMCDTCGSKCTACKIPNYGPSSTIDQVQCTSCLAGLIPSQGKCVSCPRGQFASGSSCKACSAACSSCVETAENCLTCTNRLATGECASTCPGGFFNATGTCVPCHSDCATCSGPAFNQCSKCPTDRPVLAQGRCLRTCGSKTQFFNHSTSSCQSCDSSCSSCFGAGPNKCLACSNSTAVLHNGKCSSTSCTGIALDNLGMCFTDVNPFGPNSGP